MERTYRNRPVYSTPADYLYGVARGPNEDPTFNRRILLRWFREYVSSPNQPLSAHQLVPLIGQYFGISLYIDLARFLVRTFSVAAGNFLHFEEFVNVWMFLAMIWDEFCRDAWNFDGGFCMGYDTFSRFLYRYGILTSYNIEQWFYRHADDNELLDFQSFIHIFLELRRAISNFLEDENPRAENGQFEVRVQNPLGIFEFKFRVPRILQSHGIARFFRTG